MRPPFLSQALVWRALALLALLFALSYVSLALMRAFYPYDLEFTEDGLLMQALRGARGQAIYLPPNVEFVPHSYMPLYTYFGSLLFTLLPPSYAPLRLLSLAASGVAALIIFFVARRESQSRTLGFVSAGLFFAGYRLSGGWYDLARVDSLFIALVLAACAVAIYAHASRRGLLTAALLFALAFLTKQHGIFFAAAAAIYLALSVRAGMWWFILAFALLAALPIGWLNAMSDGWFTFYVFTIAYVNPVELSRALNALVVEIGLQMGGLMAAQLIALLAVVRRMSNDKRRITSSAVSRLPSSVAWLLFIAVALVVSVSGRASVGGASNNLMPAYALLCIAPALAWKYVTGVNPRWQRRATAIIMLALIAQFALGIYNPIRYLPSSSARASGDHFIARLAQINGEVLVLMHPYYALLAGKQPSAQVAALWYARWRGRDPLPPDFVQRIQRHAYAQIISDETIFDTEPALLELLNTYYIPSTTLSAADAPSTLNGSPMQPTTIYVPRTP